jgi:DNA replication licensing factor MCM6
VDENSVSRVAASVADQDEVSSQATSSQRPTAKKGSKLSYDEYKAMSNLIVMHIRREEERMDAEGNEETCLRKSEIIEWYLQEVQDELETVEALGEKKILTEKVIAKLIKVI